MQRAKSFQILYTLNFEIQKGHLGYAKAHRLKAIDLVASCQSGGTRCAFGRYDKNSVNSDSSSKRVDDSVGYAMVLQNYYTFDHSDKTNVAIKLSWDDGAVDLNGGMAEAKIKAKVYPITYLR